MTLVGFATLALVHILALITPGPNFVLSVRVAASEGFKPATGLALGFSTAATIWATAALAGLALLFQIVPILFTSLKILGGLFLIYLAVLMWRSSRQPVPEFTTGTAPRRFLSAYRWGLLAFMTNPKPAIFFGAVFVGFVPHSASFMDKTLVIANIFVVETIWYLIVARLFSLPSIRAGYARIKFYADRSFAGVIALLGIRIALP